MTNKNLEYYENERNELMPYLNISAKKILDVGCGAGSLAATIKKRNNAEVWGIELIEDAAVKAKKKIDNVLIGKVEEKIDELPDDYFDIIIFADVLEHLYDPYTVLKKIKTKLKVEGEIVASIPNIGHWSIIKDLLQGEWEYQDWGILDRTHIRFFTKKSLLKMFEGADLLMINLAGTVTKDEPIPDTVLNAVKEIGMNHEAIKFDSEIFQYIIVAIRKDSMFQPHKMLEIALSYINEKNYLCAHTLLNRVLEINTDLNKSDKAEIENIISKLESAQ
ncbi:MAG: class I SAM-dependent methyltransferase [Melioribacteraceae bacterium]|nr:class I SAM-dependent methyltransferase [Melioribacteraceae bacterium]